MLSSMIQWSNKIINELIPGRGHAVNLGSVVSPAMVRAIECWDVLYNNNPLWVSKKDSIYTMGLPGAIASELARLATLEMKSDITGSVRANYLNDRYQKVLEDIRTYLEYGCAKGGLIMKPYFNGEGLSVDYIQADSFVPVSFDSSGRITAAIFVDTKRRGEMTYRRFEGHKVTDVGYTVVNKAFASKNDRQLGNEVPLSSVDEWCGIEPTNLISGVKIPLFGYFKVPQANRVDNASALGASVFSTAHEAGMFEVADRQYSRIIQEYILKESAIFLSETMLKDDGFGKPKLPGGMEKIYRPVDIQSGINEKQFFEPYSPEIRDTSLFNGLNKYLQRIEFECGLAYGTLSDMQLVDKTATEIKASKQRSYAAVSDIQKALKHALTDLIDAMNVLANEHKLTPTGNYEVGFKFDDSIIVDTETEQAIRMQEVAAGITRPENYLMWRYGVTKEQALEMLPDTESMIDSGLPASDPNKGDPKAQEAKQTIEGTV
ncbi:MAG: hypothetical protein RSD63_06795 [Eubacterium sp.]